MLFEKLMLKKEKPRRVRFLMQVLQIGQGYFLGPHLECRFTGIKSFEMVASSNADDSSKKSKANEKTNKQETAEGRKVLQGSSLKYKEFSFFVESLHEDCHMFCKVCRCIINVLYHDPRREAGDVWCLPPVWNLRAVIWFHFAISSLVLLPSPVTLSVLSFSACWPFLLNFFQKILQYFSLRDRLFCMAPV